MKSTLGLGQPEHSAAVSTRVPSSLEHSSIPLHASPATAAPKGKDVEGKEEISGGWRRAWQKGCATQVILHWY